MLNSKAEKMLFVKRLKITVIPAITRHTVSIKKILPLLFSILCFSNRAEAPKPFLKPVFPVLIFFLVFSGILPSFRDVIAENEISVALSTSS